MNIDNPLVHTVNEHKSGIGLQNVKKRLDLLYPETHVLLQKIENNHYLTELTIKLKKA